EKGGVGKLLGGVAPDNLPASYHTSSAYYVLRGGKSAQDWIWEHQTTLLRDSVGISLDPSPETARLVAPSFVKPGYSRVPLENQNWSTSAQTAVAMEPKRQEYEAPLPFDRSTSTVRAREHSTVTASKHAE
ncbi:hypothetical protein V5O48_019682, partial [Marasmius crinis-equi]